MPQQLPPGFEIRPHIEGPALFLDGRMVAVSSDTTSGQCRLDLCVSTAKRHSHFIPSMALAETYLARWAVKWEERIRELHR